MVPRDDFNEFMPSFAAADERTRVGTTPSKLPTVTAAAAAAPPASSPPPPHRCCARDLRAPEWQALTRWKGQALVPYTYWIRPLCTHGCDDAEVDVLDRLCFPDESNEQHVYTIEHGLHSKRCVGVIILRDGRSNEQKFGSPPRSSSGGGFFSRIASWCGDAGDVASSANRTPPLPPALNQCTGIAYAMGKVRSAARCAAVLAKSMCEGSCAPGDVCGDISSICVAPAYRGVGLASLMMVDVLRLVHGKAVETRTEILRSIATAQRQQQRLGGCAHKAVDNPWLCPAVKEGAGDDSDVELDQVPEIIVAREVDLRHCAFNDKAAEPIFSVAVSAAAAAATDTAPTGRALNAIHVTLCVRADNDPAIHLYKQHGFVFEQQKYEERYSSGKQLLRMGTWVAY